MIIIVIKYILFFPTLEKLKINFEYLFDILERDGNTYIKCKLDKTQYTYEILGGVTFAADDLYLGQEEQSKFMLLNFIYIISGLYVTCIYGPEVEMIINFHIQCLFSSLILFTVLKYNDDKFIILF